MNIVILGPPGSGKGTQSKNILALQSNSEIVDCGKLLRSSNLSEDLKKSMSEGFLLDDTVVINIVKEKLYNLNKLGKSFILDGFPRSVKQSLELFEIVDDLESVISCVIKLQLDYSLVLDRIAKRLVCINCGGLFDLDKKKCFNCGGVNYTRRDDDSDLSAIENRLKKYSIDEQDIIRLFQEFGVSVLTVDGSRRVDEVSSDIKHQLLLFS